MPDLKHFSIHEFDSPDQPGSGKLMKPEFLVKLDAARDRSDRPWIITSGYRTVAHNTAVGGVPDSAHTRGYAADISIDGWPEYDVVRLIADLTVVGFRRIGRAHSFVHVDCDPDKPSPGYWDYFKGPDHQA